MHISVTDATCQIAKLYLLSRSCQSLQVAMCLMGLLKRLVHCSTCFQNAFEGRKVVDINDVNLPCSKCARDTESLWIFT